MRLIKPCPLNATFFHFSSDLLKNILNVGDVPRQTSPKHSAAVDLAAVTLWGHQQF